MVTLLFPNILVQKEKEKKGYMSKFPPQEKERKTNLGHFDATLSPLALHCSKVSLVLPTLR